MGYFFVSSFGFGHFLFEVLDAFGHALHHLLLFLRSLLDRLFCRLLALRLISFLSPQAETAAMTKPTPINRINLSMISSKNILHLVSSNFTPERKLKRLAVDEVAFLYIFVCYSHPYETLD